jgi:hypothetical protein
MKSSAFGLETKRPTPNESDGLALDLKQPGDFFPS